MVGYQDFRQLRELLGALVDEVPTLPKAGSRRYLDAEAVADAIAGDVEVARPIGDLNIDACLIVRHLALVVDGVADVLEVAARRSNKVNGPSLAYTVRPALELAGQLAWLLDDHLGALPRTRRYMTWRLADLRSKRLLLNSFRSTGQLAAETEAEVDQDEREILEFVDAVGWTARPTSFNSPHLEAACLLDVNGKPEKLPSIEDLVREVSSSPSTYGLLSATAHGQRFGLLEGNHVDPPSESHGYSQISSFLLPIDLLIGLAVLATDVSGRMLGGWNALDTSQLHAFCGRLINPA